MVTMRIVVAGGHGKIARLLHPLLAGRGDTSVGLVRHPAHVDDLRSDGAQPLLLDLESATVEEVAAALAGADVAVFAAGAGPGSGPARKLTVDRDGAVKLADAAVRAGVPRLVQVSSMGADDADRGSTDDFQVYLGAKADADAHLRGTGLGWTVVRPGRLTDDPGTGLVEVGASVARGAVPRADVAAVLAAVVADDATARHQFEVVGGQTPVDEAVAGLIGG
jgi:uncharacterized protein YbjT (DUF2867 family)